MKLWLDKGVWTRKKAKQKANLLNIQQVRSIGVIKHAALGDLMLLRPFLITLKQYFPNAKITLDISSSYTRGAPVDLVDHVHITNGTNIKLPINQQIKNFKEFGYHDLVFDLTASTRSFMLCFLNKASLKIGFIHRNTHKLLYDVAVPRTVYKFEGESFLDQLAALGIDYKWPLVFNLKKPERIFKEPYIAIFPTASIDYKCWPANHFVELLDKLTSTIKNHKIVLLSGIDMWEKDIAHEIMKNVKTPENITLLEGKKQLNNNATDPGESCIANADLVICNDTGIRNMAIAHSVPTIGLFMATLPHRYYPRFGKHAVLFEITGEPPSVERTFNATLDIINT